MLALALTNSIICVRMRISVDPAVKVRVRGRGVCVFVRIRVRVWLRVRYGYIVVRVRVRVRARVRVRIKYCCGIRKESGLGGMAGSSLGAVLLRAPASCGLQQPPNRLTSRLGEDPFLS